MTFKQESRQIFALGHLSPPPVTLLYHHFRRICYRLQVRSPPLVTLNANDDDFKDNNDNTDAGDDGDTKGSEDKEEDDGGGSGLSAGAKARIGVGVALAVLFILGVAFLLLRTRRRKRITAVGPAAPAAPLIGPAHPSGTPSDLGGSTVRPWSTISELDGAGVAKVARDGNRGSWLRSEINGGGVGGEQREKPVTELPV